MLALALLLVGWCATALRWDWLPEYLPLMVQGRLDDALDPGGDDGAGHAAGNPAGVGAGGGAVVSGAARAQWFCTIIRGTPLLLQLWLLYYGLGSLFPQFPWIRQSDLWPILRQAWPYAVLALTLSFAGYEGEIMRGAFKGVPRGQLEAAKAMGMPRLTILRRIWLPQAIQRALPTLGGETVLQLKATPLVATITVMDIYAVSSRVRQDTFIVYEPLLLLAVVYMVITGLIVLAFRWLEKRVPQKVA